MILIEVDRQAIAYVQANLSDGLSLSQRSISALVGMRAVALVPNRTSLERLLDFKHGGLGRCDIGEVAAILAEEYPRASLVVELPLRRPHDTGVSDDAPGIMVCGDEVYVACSLRDSISIIERTLRMADPAFMYRAFILEPGKEFREEACPPDLVDSEAATLKAVLVGAYDGEGFVLARANTTARARDIDG